MSKPTWAVHSTNCDACGGKGWRISCRRCFGCVACDGPAVILRRDPARFEAANLAWRSRAGDRGPAANDSAHRWIDKKAIFTAASKASEAVTFLASLQGA